MREFFSPSCYTCFMAETKNPMLPKIDLSPDRMHNPTKADLDAWEALTDAEKEAVILAEMDDAEAEGFAPRQTMAEMIAEFRKLPGRDL